MFGGSNNNFIHPLSISIGSQKRIFYNQNQFKINKTVQNDRNAQSSGTYIKTFKKNKHIFGVYYFSYCCLK